MKTTGWLIAACDVLLALGVMLAMQHSPNLEDALPIHTGRPVP